jgi:hypothetical protein
MNEGDGGGNGGIYNSSDTTSSPSLTISATNDSALRYACRDASIATSTYVAGDKRPFAAGNNDDVSTNARGGGDYGYAFGESIALSANAKTTVETRMPSFISSVSRQSSVAVKESYSSANPEALCSTTTTANNSELMSSLSSSSFLLPWESAHSSKIIEDDRKISSMSESALLKTCKWLSRTEAGEALRNARGDVKSAIEAVTAALSTARKLTQEENASPSSESTHDYCRAESTAESKTRSSTYTTCYGSKAYI